MRPPTPLRLGASRPRAPVPRRYDGFNDTNVSVLCDDIHTGAPVAPPTLSNIREGLRWLLHNARPGDTLFLHYSGHGRIVHDPRGPPRRPPGVPGA